GTECRGNLGGVVARALRKCCLFPLHRDCFAALLLAMTVWVMPGLLRAGADAPAYPASQRPSSM
ncbi:MAG: hypothetical protein D4R82_00615, partial [Dehalococcoidia bacterium]